MESLTVVRDLKLIRSNSLACPAKIERYIRVPLPFPLWLNTHNALARHGVGCMRDMRTRREKQKLVRMVSIRDRFEVLVGVNIHCDDYVVSLTSRSLYIKRAGPILDL
jgi:hypothetical protein